MTKKIVGISAIIFIIDFISKLIIVNILKVNESILVVKNFFYLTYVRNEGAAWSILSGKLPILVIISILIIGGIIYYLYKNKQTDIFKIVAFSLILGGALGNLFDRVMYGYVIDFLDFYLFNYNYPIFNLADSAVVIGAILLLFRK